MKNVALLYAMSISLLGTKSDVACFFGVLRHSIVMKSSHDMPFLTDKLYRRSIEREDFLGFISDVNKAKSLLQNTPASDVDLNLIGFNPKGTYLRINEHNLFDVFSKIFGVLFDAIEANELFLKEFGEFVSIRIGGAEAPQYLIDQMRPVSAYAAMKDDEVPYWLR